jgi:hypothetical protein
VIPELRRHPSRSNHTHFVAKYSFGEAPLSRSKRSPQGPLDPRTQGLTEAPCELCGTGLRQREKRGAAAAFAVDLASVSGTAMRHRESPPLRSVPTATRERRTSRRPACQTAVMVLARESERLSRCAALLFAVACLSTLALPSSARANTTRKCGSRTVNGYESLTVTATDVGCATAQKVASEIYGLTKGGSCDHSPRRSCAFQIDGWRVRTRWVRSGSFYSLQATATKSRDRMIRFLLSGE